MGRCRKVEYACDQLICHAAFTALCYRSPFYHGVLPLSEVMVFSDKAEKEMIRERQDEACRVSKDALSNP
jgi:hypothetical protein